MDKDNQQQTVSDMELGWLAGFLEGEGSICLQVNNRSGRENRKQTLRVTPKVIFTNTDKAMIEAAVSIMDRMGIGKYVQTSIARPSELAPRSTKECMYIHVSGMKRVKSLLEQIHPSMYGAKKERSIRLLAFINRRLEQSEKFDSGSNLSYDAEDARLILSFMEITATKQYDHIDRMLNEHTQGRPHSKRRKMCSDLTGNSKRLQEIGPAA